MRSKLATAIILGIVSLSSGCIREKEIQIEEPIVIGSQFLVGENSKSSISFKSKIEDLALHVVNQIPENAGKLELNGESVAVEAFEVDRPAIINAVIYSKERGSEHGSARSFSIAIRNTSALQTEKLVEDIIEYKGDILELSEDYKAYKFIVDVAYLNKFIDFNEKNNLIGLFDPTESTYFSESSAAIDGLRATYQSYLLGESSESDLISQKDYLISNLNQHADYGDSKIQSLSEFYSPFISNFSGGDFNHTHQRGLSKYIGNENIGKYEGSEWVFNNDYRILKVLFTN